MGGGAAARKDEQMKRGGGGDCCCDPRVSYFLSFFCALSFISILFLILSFFLSFGGVFFGLLLHSFLYVMSGGGRLFLHTSSARCQPPTSSREGAPREANERHADTRCNGAYPDGQPQRNVAGLRLPLRASLPRKPHRQRSKGHAHTPRRGAPDQAAHAEPQPEGVQALPGDERQGARCHPTDATTRRHTPHVRHSPSVGPAKGGAHTQSAGGDEGEGERRPQQRRRQMVYMFTAKYTRTAHGTQIRGTARSGLEENKQARVGRVCIFLLCLHIFLKSFIFFAVCT